MNQTEFIFETFEEANNIHKKLFEIRRQKGYVTCADLYFLIHPDEEDCKGVYRNHGWINLWDVKVEPCDDCINGEWILKMPKVKYLNIIKRRMINNESRNYDKSK